MLHNLYMKQNNEGKRKLLDYVLSNCVVMGDRFIPEYQQPFDLLAVYKKKEYEDIENFGGKTPIHQLWWPT